MSPWLAAFGLLLLIPGALGRAHELAKAEGAEFTFPTPPFTAMTVAEACRTPKFSKRRKIITEGIRVIKANNKQDNFEAARQKLGEILHPLQDFYSHSNWVELGNIYPNPNLIRSDISIGNIAEESRATCRNCDGDDCRNNILEDIIEEGILTSGYFWFSAYRVNQTKRKMQSWRAS
ncbi:hypothetical protein JOQ06_019174 [Pogonophryne albipinna]|uniref:VWA7 N-terminal domain-containing protein n=1 Tax=Pogonophryne albipinna TaxID=1090488 RepID=A0AAD6FD37_9TELE|nr:hypothetical protein JOQ06_019174 [Pogonophryne albipinna]